MDQHPNDPGPPLLTDVIEARLAQLDQATQTNTHNLQLELLRAQLPELFEKALLRLKPQLLAEFEKILEEALKR